jgi:hypothetical protein
MDRGKDPWQEEEKMDPLCTFERVNFDQKFVLDIFPYHMTLKTLRTHTGELISEKTYKVGDPAAFKYTTKNFPNREKPVCVPAFGTIKTLGTKSIVINHPDSNKTSRVSFYNFTMLNGYIWFDNGQPIDFLKI